MGEDTSVMRPKDQEEPQGPATAFLWPAGYTDKTPREFYESSLLRLWPLLEGGQVISYKALPENGAPGRSCRWNVAVPPAVTNFWPPPKSIPASPAASCPPWNASSN